MDHTKDLVKSDGEWISTVDLENEDDVFVTEIPKTSTGKFSKRTLRDLHAAGELG